MVHVWDAARARVATYLGDLDNGKLVVLTIGVGGAVGLSLLYCLLLQLLVEPLVWLTLLGANLALIACTLLSFQKARVVFLSLALHTQHTGLSATGRHAGSCWYGGLPAGFHAHRGLVGPK